MSFTKNQLICRALRQRIHDRIEFLIDECERKGVKFRPKDFRRLMKVIPKPELLGINILFAWVYGEQQKILLSDEKPYRVSLSDIRDILWDQIYNSNALLLKLPKQDISSEPLPIPFEIGEVP